MNLNNILDALNHMELSELTLLKNYITRLEETRRSEEEKQRREEEARHNAPPTIESIFQDDELEKELFAPFDPANPKTPHFKIPLPKFLDAIRQLERRDLKQLEEAIKSEEHMMVWRVTVLPKMLENSQDIFDNPTSQAALRRIYDMAYKSGVKALVEIKQRVVEFRSDAPILLEDILREIKALDRLKENETFVLEQIKTVTSERRLELSKPKQRSTNKKTTA